MGFVFIRIRGKKEDMIYRGLEMIRNAVTSLHLTIIIMHDDTVHIHLALSPMPDGFFNQIIY